MESRILHAYWTPTITIRNFRAAAAQMDSISLEQKVINQNKSRNNRSNYMIHFLNNAKRRGYMG